MKQGTKLYSVLKNRCPRCGVSPFFESDNPYKPGSMLKMNERCPHCGLNNLHEPGFYLGAMYVSYILAVGLALTTGVFIYAIWHTNLTFILFVIGALLIITSPLNFRLARLIWINIWVKYDPEMKSDKK